MGEFIIERKDSGGKLLLAFKQTRTRTAIERFTKDSAGPVWRKLNKGEKPKVLSVEAI